MGGFAVVTLSCALYTLEHALSLFLQVIPQPAFMVKADALWTEDERKQFKEYEKKVKELNEERDKYRKVRRTEN